MGVITGRLIGAAGPTALAVPSVGQIVENVVALRALTGSADLPAVTLRQYSSAGPDLGGGVFVWDAVARTDDGGHNFNAGGFGSSGAGWRRVGVTPGEYRAEHYGWLADGVSDNDAAWARVLGAGAGNLILLPSGVALVPGGLALANDTVIRGTGAATVVQSTAAAVVSLTAMVGGAVEDLTLIGDGSDYCLDVHDAHRFRLTNVRCAGAGLAGVRGRNSVLAVVDKFTCSTAVGTPMPSVGILMDTDGVLGCYAWQILEPVIEGCDTGIDYSSGLYTKIRGGTVEACVERGVRFQATCGKSSISDVHFEANGNEGDVRCAGTQIQILNCQCLSGTFPQYGAFLTATSTSCAVIGGVISAAVDEGTRNLWLANVTGALDVTGATSPHAAYLDTAGAHALRWGGFEHTDTGVIHGSGTYHPENNVAAPVGSTYSRSGSVAGAALYVKESGTGSTGWKPLLPFSLITYGTGSPEGAVVGSVGDVYHRTDGGAGTALYVKESGAATNTGWVAHAAIGLGLLAPGSESYASGQWHIQYQRLQLTSTQRLTLAGTARYILTDL